MIIKCKLLTKQTEMKKIKSEILGWPGLDQTTEGKQLKVNVEQQLY